MLHFIQIYKLVLDKELFINLLDDLSYEIEELGYKGSEADLVHGILDNHFGIFLEDERQLERVTEHILKYQGKMRKHCETLEVLFNIAV